MESRLEDVAKELRSFADAYLAPLLTVALATFGLPNKSYGVLLKRNCEQLHLSGV